MIFSLGVAKPKCSHGHILCTTCLRLKTWRQGVRKIDKRTASSLQAFYTRFQLTTAFVDRISVFAHLAGLRPACGSLKKATILRSFPTYCLFLLIHFRYASWQGLLASVLKLNCSQLLARSLQIILDPAGLCWDFFLEAALYDSSIANHPCFMSTYKLLIT